MNKTALFLIFLGLIGILAFTVNVTFYTQSTNSGITEIQYQKLVGLMRQQEVEISVLQNKLQSGANAADCTDDIEETERWKKEATNLKKKIIELERTYSQNAKKSTEGTPEDPKVALFKKKLDDYAELHKKITTGKLPPRYVQCVLINGWGNVFQEAISCVLFGIMSNRAAIFNTGGIDGYMPFKEAFRAEDMPWDAYNTRAMSQHPDLVIPRFDLPCLNISSKADAPLITIHLTYDWYAPSMLVNPYHGEEMWEILPENYYQIMFNYIFKLNPEYMKAVEEFKQKHFGGYTVAIQIRNPTNDKSGKKDHKGFPVPPLYLYAQAAEQLSRFQTQASYESVTWFMATQNTELIQNLKSHYGTKIIAYDGKITTTFESDKEGQKVALITWWIMSEADEVVTTEASSYGTTAASRNGKHPIVCTHHKYCFRRMSPTPCQDTPFLVDQPDDCLAQKRKFPHQYLTAPDNSCGFYKHHIYTSPEYNSDSWNIKQ